MTTANLWFPGPGWTTWWSVGAVELTSLCSMSTQLNKRENGRIQGGDQEKGWIRGQSVRGSAAVRSERRCGRTLRYQGYWMGMSMVRLQERSKWIWGLVSCRCSSFIGLTKPSDLCRLHPRPPSPSLPSRTSHVHWHGDLIFVEQWAPLLFPPLLSLFDLWDWDLLSLPSLCHKLTLAQRTADAPLNTPVCCRSVVCLPEY